MCLKTCIILQIPWSDNKKKSFIVINPERIEDKLQIFKEFKPFSHLCNWFFCIDFLKYLTHDSYKHIHESNLSHNSCDQEQEPAYQLINLTFSSIVIKIEFTKSNQVEV